jgi:hypothetical protein
MQVAQRVILALLSGIFLLDSTATAQEDSAAPRIGKHARQPTAISHSKSIVAAWCCPLAGGCASSAGGADTNPCVWATLPSRRVVHTLIFCMRPFAVAAQTC